MASLAVSATLTVREFTRAGDTRTSRPAGAIGQDGVASEDEPEVWRLYRGDELVAQIIVTDSDFPWLYGRLEPTAAFATVRPLFEDALRLWGREEGPGMSAWGTAQIRIRQTVTLHYPEGGEVPEFLLHIDGDAASWRWLDEPFED